MWPREISAFLHPVPDRRGSELRTSSPERVRHVNGYGGFSRKHYGEATSESILQRYEHPITVWRTNPEAESAASPTSESDAVSHSPFFPHTVIAAVPLAVAVTRPAASTVATGVPPLLHATVAPAIPVTNCDNVVGATGLVLRYTLVAGIPPGTRRLRTRFDQSPDFTDG